MSNFFLRPTPPDDGFLNRLLLRLDKSLPVGHIKHHQTILKPFAHQLRRQSVSIFIFSEKNSSLILWRCVNDRPLNLRPKRRWRPFFTSRTGQPSKATVSEPHRGSGVKLVRFLLVVHWNYTYSILLLKKILILNAIFNQKQVCTLIFTLPLIVNLIRPLKNPNWHSRQFNVFR